MSASAFRQSPLASHAAQTSLVPAIIKFNYIHTPWPTRPPTYPPLGPLAHPPTHPARASTNFFSNYLVQAPLSCLHYLISAIWYIRTHTRIYPPAHHPPARPHATAPKSSSSRTTGPPANINVYICTCVSACVCVSVCV